MVSSKYLHLIFRAEFVNHIENRNDNLNFVYYQKASLMLLSVLSNLFDYFCNLGFCSCQSLIIFSQNHLL